MGTSPAWVSSHRARWRQAAAALSAVLVLAGCDGAIIDRPVDWWHDLQGGPIAAQRPPPPGITDPYPNFGRIPARPAPVDFASKRALLARLTSQREQTTRLNQQEPITFSAAKPAAKPPPATPPAAAADASRLSFEGASPTATPPPSAPLPPFVAQNAATAVESGPVPPIPQAPPPLPRVPGLPTSDPAPAIPRTSLSAPVVFARGSAALPSAAETALKVLASRRGGAPIAVTAGGEARSPSPQAQREALPLALRRTGAITAALIAAGVPAADIRAEAVAQGRDARARLLD